MVDFPRLEAAARLLKVVENVAVNGGREVVEIGDGHNIVITVEGDDR